MQVYRPPRQILWDTSPSQSVQQCDQEPAAAWHIVASRCRYQLCK